MRNPLNAVTRTFAALGAPRANMLVIAVAYGIFAVSLVFQPRRWGLTPAYHNLLAIMPQDAWGTVFAVTSALLLAAVARHGSRRLAVLALSAGIAITTFWCAAFVVRWLTSPNTTPETWVSWCVFDFVLLRALLLLGSRSARG